MAEIKIGILKEGKLPPDKRVPLTPLQCKDLISQYPNLDVVVHQIHASQQTKRSPTFY